MGTKNRQRRGARAKTREQHRRRADAYRAALSGDAFAAHSQPPAAEQVIAAALDAHHHADVEEVERCLKQLVEGASDPAGRRRLSTALIGWLQRSVGAAWARGWQPADVVRVIGRRLGDPSASLAIDSIAAQMRSYPASRVDQRWVAQVQGLDAHLSWDDHEFLDHWGARAQASQEAAVRCAIEVLYVIDTLPEIPRLCPLPGGARPGATQSTQDRRRPADQRMLDRVRALLAKAEATEFPGEAEAFTAKAQELMARHCIDHALLAAAGANADTPSGVRIGIDNPYESAKSLLLQKVAGANRCRAVWSREFGFATVVGYPDDVDGVELLYTSLLVQATAAMVAAGSRKDAFGRSRTRSFRRAFLTAYATRIGQRLQTATENASTQAGQAVGAERLLPVLAARDGVVQETLEALFPGLVSRPVTINNREGWIRGTAAADLASLNTRREISEGAQLRGV